MTELKTLKDLQTYVPMVCTRTGDALFVKSEPEDNVIPAVFGKDLRREAIEWIKHLIKDIESRSHKEYNEENFKEDGCFLKSPSHLPARNNHVRIQWIKHFFNLTTEDLKGENEKKGKKLAI